MRDPLAVALTRALGIQVHDAATPVGGGSIHSSFSYRTERGRVFVKVCALRAEAMLATEADGLRELASARAIRVPEVLALGKLENRAFLCLEWLDLGTPNRIAHTRLGEQLAALHAKTAPEYGWHQDNFIGLTPQCNRPHASWPEFFRRCRLEPQLDLAERKGADKRMLDRGRQLCELVPEFFSTYRPVPSLLHGDLWGGNWGATGLGEPVIFDPAVYYGDREADLAMTRLFGGFDSEFYAAYDATWPLDP
ncbi:MAG TPA: fructosamine kinase family protein, partial [Steroidobacteraceae bacterium]